MAKPALGRGLGALMGGSSQSVKPAPATAPAQPPAPQTGLEPGERVHKLAVSRIKPCALQPRKQFDEQALRELADSIKEQGVLQPLVVREKGADYELIAGERRWRAAQLAGLSEVPVVVREADDRQVLELALIENLQRENLNPIEEAHGYSQLLNQFNLTQEDAAARVGKSRVTVANLLRLLHLPPDVQGYLRSNLISAGHAKAILGLPSADAQKLAAEEVIRDGLSVRATEDLVANRTQSTPAEKGETRNGRPSPTADIHVTALQERLQEKLGTKVLLKYRKGKGAVEIRFFTDEDLQRVLDLLGVKLD
jgi:ParB family chromosome partitioning protein